MLLKLELRSAEVNLEQMPVPAGPKLPLVLMLKLLRSAHVSVIKTYFKSDVFSITWRTIATKQASCY